MYRLVVGIMRGLVFLGCMGILMTASVSDASAAASTISQPLVIRTIALPGVGTALHVEVGRHAGLFMFDTGGGVTIVTPATANESGCRLWGQVTGFRATGERIDTPRCDDLRMAIGGMNVIAPTASVVDLQRMMPTGIPVISGVLALDVFAGRAITIRPMAHELIVETPSSLPRRVAGATAIPVRLVRDAEGLALTVDGAVQTPLGRAWMELDTGNAGPIMIGAHVSAPLGLLATDRTPRDVTFQLVGGVLVHGPARVSSLIMDGDIGESMLEH